MIPSVTEEQLARFSGVMKRRLIEGGADGAVFEHMLRNPGFVGRLDGIIKKAGEEYRATTPIIERSPVATVRIGEFKTADNLCQAFTDAGYVVDDGVRGVLSNVPMAVSSQEIDLYRATIPELGLGNGKCKFAEAFDAIKRVGGIALPAEAELVYCLEYPEQCTMAGVLIYTEFVAGEFRENVRFYAEVRNGAGFRNKRCLAAYLYNPSCSHCGGWQRNYSGWLFGKPPVIAA